MTTEDELKFVISCLIPEAPNDSSYEIRQVLRNIVSKLGIFHSCQILAFQFQNFTEESLPYKNEELPFQFVKCAGKLGFLKEAQMNEYNERLINLKYSCSSISDTEKNNNPQQQSSFSFNPFKTLKNMPKNDNYRVELDNGSIFVSDNKSERESNKKQKNESSEEQMDKIEPIMYSPSSYSGFLNSRDSSVKGKGIREDSDFLNCGNLVMIEKEQDDI